MNVYIICEVVPLTSHIQKKIAGAGVFYICVTNHKMFNDPPNCLFPKSLGLDIKVHTTTPPSVTSVKQVHSSYETLT